MTDGCAKPDWSRKCWKEMLVFQRRSMWLDDAIEKLAAWMDLRQGITAVDVGCGLGYLGYTFWKHFGKGGRYIGIDNTAELVEEAREAAKDWAIGGKAEFEHADACKLPLPDDCADWVMCQTLLIHLSKPESALSEMLRVAKPGGLITCFEPDNHNPALGMLYSSVPEPSIEDHLLLSKILIMCHKGRIKLGNGDNSIGRKVPRMMKLLGMTDIGVRCNEQVHYLEPPYDDPLQQRALENLKKWWLDEERHATFRAREKEEFLAAGGDLEEFDRYVQTWEKYRATMKAQLDAGEYFACAAGAFYLAKARKPAV